MELIGCFSNCTHLFLSYRYVLSWPLTQKFDQSINQSIIYILIMFYNQLFYHPFVCESFGMSGMSMNSNDTIHFIDKIIC